MSLFADPLFPYVAVAYGSTALVLGLLVALSLRANARARRDLAEAEREGRNR